VLREDLADQFASAPDAGLVEDRLEVELFEDRIAVVDQDVPDRGTGFDADE
jgi:hypothetical protein